MSELNQEEGIHTDFREQMTYGDYLRLHSLLDCQKLLSGHHDEMLFVIIHQTSELWMKLMIHEMEAAMKLIREGELSAAFKMLSRFSKIQSQMIQSWDVLSTLTPSEYTKFRSFLGHASGFQSYQYRLIEFYLGNKSPYILNIYENDADLLEKLKKAYASYSIYDVSIQAMHKAGFPINPKVLNRDVRKPYQYEESVENAWLQVYQNVEKYWDFYELAEKLVDIEDWFQQWRFRHMKTVERIIGYKKGTGGSSGVSYLKRGLDHCFFPELWHVRTKL